MQIFSVRERRKSVTVAKEITSDCVADVVVGDVNVRRKNCFDVTQGWI